MGAQFALALQTLFYALQGFSGFMFSLTGDQPVEDVLPKIAVLFEVEDDPRPFTLLVNNEMNTLHWWLFLLELWVVIITLP